MRADPLTVRDGLPTPARYFAMAAILVGLTLAVLDSTIVNLALPGIAHDLNTSASRTIWVVNAYQVAILGLLLPLAMLGDIAGYRKVYLSGALLFTFASIGCALAPSFGVLALSRGLQGLGASGIMAVTPALIRLIYPKRLLGRGVAINSLVIAVASVAGPSIAAAILSVAHWPWLFVVNLPLGALVLALGWRGLPDNVSPPPANARLRPTDVVLNMLMFGLVFLGVDTLGTGMGGSGDAWLPGVTLLVAGLAIGAWYVRRQLALAVPMLALDLLRIPIFALSMCTSIAAFGAQMLSYIALPFLLLDVYGRSHVEAGLLITAWPLGVVITAPVAGRLIGRYADGLLAGVGLGVLAVGLVLLANLSGHPSNADIAWRMVVCGIGFGLFQSPNNHAIVTSAPAQRTGAAGGMLGTARLTGQTIGAVLLASIFTVASAHGRGPTVALVVAAVLAAVASGFSTLRRASEAVHA
jgi:DHA2 family multidrug resistance protein-like MFS transporter